MNKTSQFLAAALIGALAAAGMDYFVLSGNARPQAVAAKESVYDRVMRTRTLRCAYLVYPPETIKDPNTGKLTGIIVDTMEELGRQLGWKIDWVAEVGFQDMFEGLKTGRYDALCVGLWENSARSKEALFSQPMDFGVINTVARSDDSRFDESLEPINDPNVKVAEIDGELGQVIQQETFPKASTYLLPTLSDVSMIVEAVATGKADVAFLPVLNVRKYMEQNPGKVKILKKNPSRVFPAPLLAVPHGEHDLKYVVDATLRGLQESRFVDRILQKYDPTRESYLLPAKAYEQRP
ncbi:MAG: transporter substrate-binding domain-containing protein [Alphaproteobacteria bacterium]|nr:transporter substrate-binding domain-containing protein [Alphaproteobacteria bacterium]